MTYVPFTVKMTEDQITDKLKSLYGTEFTAADIKAFVAMNDITYQTVTRKLQKYKVSKGKWNLEVTQKVVDKILKKYKKKIFIPDHVYVSNSNFKYEIKKKLSKINKNDIIVGYEFNLKLKKILKTALISNGQIGYFIVNILLNNLLGILFIYLGFKISKLV